MTTGTSPEAIAAMLRACKGRVRVNALKWHQNKTHGSMYDYRIYAVHQGNKYGIFSTFLERDQWGSRVQVAKCVPLEAAKAAAQADYEARILAAIELAEAKRDALKTELVSTLSAAILDAQIRALENRQLDTPDQIRANACEFLARHQKGPSHD